MQRSYSMLLALIALSCVVTPTLAAVFDDFNDGIDDGWQYYNPIPGSISLPTESGSPAYQLKSPAGSLYSPGRIGSINTQEPPHSKFHIEADLLNWTYNWGEDVGLMARVQEPLPSFFLPQGYALLFRNDRDGNPQSRKLMIVKSPGGVRFPVFLAKGLLMTPAPDPSGDYRLKFWSEDGKLWGQMLDKKSGKAIQMWQGDRRVDRISAIDDGEFKSGRSGLIAYVHIVSYRAEGVSPVFDNFYSGSNAPEKSLCSSKFSGDANTGSCR